MDINANKIRLQFDGLELHFDRDFGWSKKTGWSVKRDDFFVVSMVSWEEAWSVLTTAERVRCIVFANNLR
jgi:hypothetical protein